MSLASASWKTTAASLPLFLWARDSLFGVCRVQGTSMEPTLHDGDIVVVRKCDAGVLIESFARLWISSNNNKGTAAIETDRARLRRYEQLQQGPQHQPMGRFYQCPPTALSGHVVVFSSPTEFPSSLSIKRVIGVGGQWMRVDQKQSGSIGSSSSRRLQSLPSHSLYVQGDNVANSQDSRKYGAVSKNLLVGIAEYVVWPPSRWQRIQRIVPEDSKGKPRAFWP